MSDVEVLGVLDVNILLPRHEMSSLQQGARSSRHTLIPSSEKQGGTAELSSSASLSKTGNFSTADMGRSPR